MRVLADSNMFIDYWKKPTQEVKNVFSNEDVVICGVVRSELLCGARSKADFERIDTYLNGFEEISLDESDWRSLGGQLYALRTSGITVPFTDAIIACVALKYNLQIWTRDNHFAHIQSVFKDLQLYNM